MGEAKDFRAAELTVKKICYAVPVDILGTDEQGRTLVRCPSRGCDDTAYIAEDGRVVCPTGEAESTAFEALFAAAMADFDSLDPTRSREVVAAGPSIQVPHAVVGRVVDGRTSLPGLGTGTAAYASALTCRRFDSCPGAVSPFGVHHG